MPDREIPRAQWREQLDKFSRAHEGSIVRVEIIGGDGQRRVESKDLPLHGVSADSPRDNAVAIMVGRAPDDHITHEVQNAVNIAIEQGDSGGERALRIKGSDGTVATVEFRSER